MNPKPQSLTPLACLSVRGLPPYYLVVPGSHKVLFVTEDNRHGVVFHVVEPSAGDAVAIDGKGSSFGWSIGSKRSAGEPMTDWIESAVGNEITIVSRGGENTVRTVLNVSRKVIERQEVIRPK